MSPSSGMPHDMTRYSSRGNGHERDATPTREAPQHDDKRVEDGMDRRDDCNDNDSDTEPFCVVCGMRAGFMCSRCSASSARYCSQQCQRAHWPTHRIVCSRIAHVGGGGGGLHPQTPSYDVSHLPSSSLQAHSITRPILQNTNDTTPNAIHQQPTSDIALQTHSQPQGEGETTRGRDRRSVLGRGNVAQLINKEQNMFVTTYRYFTRRRATANTTTASDTTPIRDPALVSNDDSIDMWENIRFYVTQIHLIVKPVLACIVLSILWVKLTQPMTHYYSFSASNSPYIAPIGAIVNDENKDLRQAFISAIIIVAEIVGATIVIVILFYFKFVRVLLGFFIIVVAFLLGLFSYSLGIAILGSHNLAMDYMSFIFLIWNFAAVGVLMIFYKGPMYMQQIYLVLMSSMMAYTLTRLPALTTWILLSLLALWDLFAVLFPFGPLRILVESSKKNNNEIPGLMYTVMAYMTDGYDAPQQRNSEENNTNDGNHDNRTPTHETPTTPTNMTRHQSNEHLFNEGTGSQQQQHQVRDIQKHEESPVSMAYENGKSFHTSPVDDGGDVDSLVDRRNSQLLDRVGVNTDWSQHRQQGPSQFSAGFYGGTKQSAYLDSSSESFSKMARFQNVSSHNSLPRQTYGSDPLSPPPDFDISNNQFDIANQYSGIYPHSPTTMDRSRLRSQQVTNFKLPIVRGQRNGQVDGRTLISKDGNETGSASAYGSTSGAEAIELHPVGRDRQRPGMSVLGKRKGGQYVRLADTATDDSSGLILARMGAEFDATQQLHSSSSSRNTLSSESEISSTEESDGADSEEREAQQRTELRLGLGDFVFYSVLIGRAATFDWITTFACVIAVLTGMNATIFMLAIFKKALPALPISIAFGLLFYFVTSILLVGYCNGLSRFDSSISAATGFPQGSGNIWYSIPSSDDGLITLFKSVGGMYYV